MKVLYFIILAIVTALLTGCEGSTSDHHQGVNCAQCHSGGENAFTSGASIFSTLNAGNSTEKSADNYSLRLVLAQSGSKINYSTGRGSGNAHATFNAGVARYTAQVVDAQGNVVNSSATNSHDSSRFDCNRCHTSSGVNGAPGRIVSFKYTRPTATTTSTTSTTTAIAAKSFAKDVLPILTANCKGCHGGYGNFSITNNTPYAGVTPFVDISSPANSRLIQKGSGGLGHGGGRQLTSTEFTTLRDWISQGAKNN